MKGRVTLEICVDSLDLALAAVRGGADRLELCGPLQGGGITPSAGLAASARARIQLPLAMLIRARTGAFTATPAEFEVMRQDVLYARTLGMDIVVLGLLREDATVDVDRTRELVDLAKPMQVTFHRAFDHVPDQEQALEEVIAAGVDRILTAGGTTTGVLGAPQVATLRRLAGERVQLLLCGGINAAHAEQAVRVSGVREVHAALRHSARPHAGTGGHTPADLDRFAAAVSRLKGKLAG